MRLLLKICLFLLIFIVQSCSKNAVDKKEFVKITPELIYSEALNEFYKKNYVLAVEKFKEVQLKFPLSSEAIQSQIMSAFIDYIRLEYNTAILKFEKIIIRYPSYKNIDYAHYMKAMCYYEQIENPDLDGKFNKLALESFMNTISRFPNSKYSKDSHQKIILIKENIAAKHMNIGMFYLKQKKYLAALKRYQRVIDEHSQSKYVPEAIHRLVEIYYTLGMIEEAKIAASVLGYNYPESEWYKYSYKIVGEAKTKESKKIPLLTKILNKISFNNEKE